jgi:hypothetical protein
VMRSERQISTVENMNLKIPLVETFSDYRRVGGVAVPFRIESIEGNPDVGIHTWTTILQNVVINGGLSPTLFERGGQE